VLRSREFSMRSLREGLLSCGELDRNGWSPEPLGGVSRLHSKADDNGALSLRLVCRCR
jgi:hypothetical protein